jgi:hypothetical protein
VILWVFFDLSDGISLSSLNGIPPSLNSAIILVDGQLNSDLLITMNIYPELDKEQEVIKSGITQHCTVLVKLL